MCFSARASFTAGVPLILLGLVCMALIPVKAKTSMNSIERFALETYAAVPLIFGIHQVAEGFVWLDQKNLFAIRVFAYTAYGFWPLYLCTSTTLIEWTRTRSLPAVERYILFSWPRRVFSPVFRRWTLLFNTILAFMICLVLSYCLWELEPLRVTNKHGGRLEYKTCTRWVPDWWVLLGRCLYVYAICGSLLLSSVQYSVIVASLSFFSSVSTYYLWKRQFESTWCYFASVISSSFFYCIWKELHAYPACPRSTAQTSEHSIDLEMIKKGDVLDPNQNEEASETTHSETKSLIIAQEEVLSV